MKLSQKTRNSIVRCNVIMWVVVGALLGATLQPFSSKLWYGTFCIAVVGAITTPGGLLLNRIVRSQLPDLPSSFGPFSSAQTSWGRKRLLLIFCVMGIYLLFVARLFTSGDGATDLITWILALKQVIGSPLRGAILGIIAGACYGFLIGVLSLGSWESFLTVGESPGDGSTGSTR